LEPTNMAVTASMAADYVVPASAVDYVTPAHDNSFYHYANGCRCATDVR